MEDEQRGGVVRVKLERGARASVSPTRVQARERRRPIRVVEEEAVGVVSQDLARREERDCMPEHLPRVRQRRRRAEERAPRRVDEAVAQRGLDGGDEEHVEQSEDEEVQRSAREGGLSREFDAQGEAGQEGVEGQEDEGWEEPEGCAGGEERRGMDEPRVMGEDERGPDLGFVSCALGGEERGETSYRPEEEDVHVG